jgi:hypothetical protein
MKTLILIAAFLLTTATKLIAQESAIEIKGFEKQSLETTKNGESTSNQGTHQFEIVANENVDVNLKFSLKTEDNLNVVVKDKRNNIVYSENFQKEGENKIVFTMEEDEKYIVMLDGEKQSNMIVDVFKD